MTVSGARMGGAFHFTSGYDDGTLQLRTATPACQVGFDASWWVNGLAAMRRTPGSVREVMWGRSGATVLSQMSRLGAALADTEGWRECWAEPIIDSFGLVARDADGAGFCAFVGLDSLARLSAADSRTLTKVATHIGTGDRLRRARHQNLLDSADAIISPNGEILHAVAAAKEDTASLIKGRRLREQARQSKDEGAKALDVWRGLVSGRWSLVDHFDTDGKRFLLAIKNPPQVEPRVNLTASERRICALVAMGHRDKEIAYMLGLSISSVASALHRGRIKLGVKTRAELVTAWRRESDA